VVYRLRVVINPATNFDNSARYIVIQPIDCFGATDRGKKRETNQDHFLIADLVKTMRTCDTSLNLHNHTRLSGHSQGKLLLVSDGMGGHLAGGRASELAVETLNAYVLNTMH